MTATVRAAAAANAAPDLWEVQNEPGSAGYYPSGVRPTVDQMLTQFAVAYRAVKAADPAARLVGPSLALFEDHPSPEHQDLDLATFLDFADRNHLRFDAVAWHELMTRPTPGHDAGWWVTSPAVIEAHASKVRALLALHRSLGHPLLIVGEYAPLAQHLVPGWNVGYLAAIDAAGLDGAGRSCWGSTDLLSQRYSECEQGLDGLFGVHELAPTPTYWVHLAYAQMVGTRVAVGSSAPSLSAMATLDAGSGHTTVLLGRHVSCAAASNPLCDQPARATPPPIDVRLDVEVPAATGTYAVAAVVRIPAGIAALPDPALGSPPQSLPVVNGHVHLDLSGVADGEALVVTMT